MNQEYLYLKPNVVIEPLVDRWFAWSHLVSPATAAMNIFGRNLKIIDSYIQAPQLHAAAVKNIKMLGGPFMDLQGGRIDDVKTLKAHIESEQKDMIEFAKAIKELDSILNKQAKGFSLEPLYDSIPEVLKGFVELVYDLNNRPSFRIYEALLYRSAYYKEASQSIALWITENDERPFVLSTPRLDGPNVLHLKLPFRHRGIDEFAKMKRHPQSLSYIRDLLGIDDKDSALFNSLFTDKPFVPYDKYQGEKVRMRYFGHACILIETKSVSVLVDPLISYYGYSSSIEHFSDYDLPETIDFVLITHNHQDHILLETLLPLRHKIKQLIVPATTSGALQDPNLKLMFNAIGFANVIEIKDLESIVLEDVKITGIPFIGEHSDLNIQSKMCYHLEIQDFSVLFAADSCNIQSRLYERIHEYTGDIDIVFLGMECEGAPLSWLYGPLMVEPPARDMDRSRTLSGSNFQRGKALVDVFRPKEVYVYAMGLEPWLEFISSKRYTDQDHPIVESNKLVEYCRRCGIGSERLFGEKELLRDKEPALLT